MKLVRSIAAAAAFALAGLTGAAQAQPIKVGVIFPLSGGAGPQGQHCRKAIQTMAALINEAGGVLGRQIEIVARDDESTPAVGRVARQRADRRQACRSSSKAGTAR